MIKFSCLDYCFIIFSRFDHILKCIPNIQRYVFYKINLEFDEINSDCNYEIRKIYYKMYEFDLDDVMFDSVFYRHIDNIYLYSGVDVNFKNIMLFKYEFGLLSEYHYLTPDNKWEFLTPSCYFWNEWKN